MRAPVEEQALLPANICVNASDLDACAKTAAALDLLNLHTDRNAVIMTDPLWQPRTQEIAALDRLTGGARLKIKIYSPTLAKIEDTLLRTFEKRAEQAAQRSRSARVPISEADISMVSANLYSGVEENIATGRCKVVSATLNYMSDFGPTGNSGLTLNIHIDLNHGDTFSLREVKTQAGSATAVFGDENFYLVTCAQNPLRSAIALKEEIAYVDTWSGPEGSSVLLRVPSVASFTKGARPTAHAPGLASQAGNRSRWVNVFDLQPI